MIYVRHRAVSVVMMIAAVQQLALILTDGQRLRNILQTRL